MLFNFFAYYFAERHHYQESCFIGKRCDLIVQKSNFTRIFASRARCDTKVSLKNGKAKKQH